VDENAENILKTKSLLDSFLEFSYIASGENYEEGMSLILEHQPELVFLEIDPEATKTNLSLAFINELHRFLIHIPKIIILTSKKDKAFEAIQYQVFHYILKPLNRLDVIKTLLKLNKIAFDAYSMQISVEPSSMVSPAIKREKQLIICIKSYGDHRYLRAADICYFQADNNSTDIYTNSGEMITAFKTLKHFEAILSSPFIRIHNSYIININFIARIHNGNSVCYIKNSPKKIPFSKTYKSNVDLIIAEFSKGNYIRGVKIHYLHAFNTHSLSIGCILPQIIIFVQEKGDLSFSFTSEK
jgi:DNA-binding LytR/AlgR family response regulator